MPDVLADALRLLREEWGTADVAWGRINRHQRPLPGEPARAPEPLRYRSFEWGQTAEHLVFDQRRGCSVNRWVVPASTAPRV